MAFSINTNEAALIALRTLGKATQNLSATSQRISTGQRVSSAADDGAVFAISKKTASDVAAWGAVRERQLQGRLVLDTALAGSNHISNILSDIKSDIMKLSDAMSPEQKQYITDSITSKLAEINDTAYGSSFNGNNLLIHSEPVQIPANSQNQPGSATYPPMSGGIGTLGRSGSGIPSLLDGILGHPVGSWSVGIGKAIPGDTWTVNFSVPDPAKTITFNVSMVDNLGNHTVIGSSGPVNGPQPVITQANSPANVIQNLAPGSFACTVPPLPDPSSTYGLNIDISGPPDTDFLVFAHNSSTPIPGNYSPPPNQDGGSFSVLRDIEGNDFKVEFRLMTTTGLGLTPLILDPISMAMQQIGGAIEMAGDNMNYWSGKSRLIDSTMKFGDTMIDALQMANGVILDADMAAESAKLEAEKIKQQLAAQTLGIVNNAPQLLLGLFR